MNQSMLRCKTSISMSTSNPLVALRLPNGYIKLTSFRFCRFVPHSRAGQGEARLSPSLSFSFSPELCGESGTAFAPWTDLTAFAPVSSRPFMAIHAPISYNIQIPFEITHDFSRQISDFVGISSSGGAILDQSSIGQDLQRMDEPIMADVAGDQPLGGALETCGEDKEKSLFRRGVGRTKRIIPPYVGIPR